ncbi:hypothetical protein CRG98_003376 [Punica granatum]|uniref:Uncharacterized protein n=1 Tax=Punica granatum TaxID=22663 RepID=A0A2I0L6C0_PUNGR|nr:hypothetical protein CRG98_003376 [Punica granatum]
MILGKCTRYAWKPTPRQGSSVELVASDGPNNWYPSPEVEARLEVLHIVEKGGNCWAGFLSYMENGKGLTIGIRVRKWKPGSKSSI